MVAAGGLSDRIAIPRHGLSLLKQLDDVAAAVPGSL
jgi:hypothetical protein